MLCVFTCYPWRIILKGAFLYGAGPCEENLRLYKAFVEKKKAEKKHVPLAVGVLIFDEVKVISRLMWNSRSQQMIGLAMQPEDMASLLDVYSTYNELGTDAKTYQTSYIMQFLWRDLSSSYDIVGPYYTSSGSFKSKGPVDPSKARVSFHVSWKPSGCFTCMVSK